MLLLLLFSCTNDAGVCMPGYVLVDETHCDPLWDTGEPTGGSDGAADSGGGTDGGTTDGGTTDGGTTDGFSFGDPITRVDVVEPSTSNGGFYEFTDGVMLDSGHAMMVGQGGYAVIDPETGEELRQYNADRAYRVDVDATTGVAWATTRDRGIYGVDASDPDDLIGLGGTWSSGARYMEDVAADSGLLLIAAQEDGVIVAEYTVDGAISQLGSVPTSMAFSVAMAGDRALYADNDLLVLLDLSDPSDPAELDRFTMDGEGRDIALRGDDVAVALGGDGVVVLEIVDDVLVERGELEMPGSSFSVAFDGDYLWAAAWDAVALAWIGEGDPFVLAHEPNEQYALGVAAADGKAVIADWLVATTMHLNAGVWGPEVEVPDEVRFSSEGDRVPITFKNAGPVALELEIEALDGASGFVADAASVTLATGETHTHFVESSEGHWAVNLKYSSNDPDEESAEINLTSQATGLDEDHPDMALWGFEYPDTELRLYDLDDHRGEVVLLAYFATF